MHLTLEAQLPRYWVTVSGFLCCPYWNQETYLIGSWAAGASWLRLQSATTGLSLVLIAVELELGVEPELGGCADTKSFCAPELAGYSPARASKDYPNSLIWTFFGPLSLLKGHLHSCVGTMCKPFDTEGGVAVWTWGPPLKLSLLA